MSRQNKATLRLTRDHMRACEWCGDVLFPEEREVCIVCFLANFPWERYGKNVR